MVAPSFNGVIVVISGDVVNSMFCITLIIFVKVLPRNWYYGFEFITTSINKIGQPQW